MLGQFKLNALWDNGQPLEAYLNPQNEQQIPVETKLRLKLLTVRSSTSEN